MIVVLGGCDRHTGKLFSTIVVRRMASVSRVTSRIDYSPPPYTVDFSIGSSVHDDAHQGHSWSLAIVYGPRGYINILPKQ